MKKIYFDNVSTTSLNPEVLKTYKTLLDDYYCNSDALYDDGVAIYNMQEKARKLIADSFNVGKDEIIFTSGASEANSLAIKGLCFNNTRKHLITSIYEHSSVYNSFKQLEEHFGYEVTYLYPDEKGMIRPDDVRKALRPDTLLVSIMLVNNEIGTVEPIAKMSKIVRKKAPDAYFHVDAVQGFCKVPCKPSELGIDLMSISGHKIHGPKGTGVLYIKKGTHLDPILFGGGQQKGIRPGTENVPGIAGLGVAAKKCHTNSKTSTEHMRKVLNRLKQKLVENIDNIRINTPQDCAPHILNVSFGGVRSEVLLHSLENEGIYVSSGSACSSHKKEPSYVLTAIGVDRAMIDGSIRFSLCEFNTEEEADRVAADAAAIVKRLRKLNLR